MAKKEDKLVELRSVAEKEGAVEQKLDELVSLLSKNEFDSETIKQLRSKVNTALDNVTNANSINAFKAVGDNADMSREQLLDEFSTLLITHKFDSKSSTKYLKVERTNKIVLMAIGIILITLGFAMIIMPAPPYFEMFTIFYFTRDDGVTLMDLISLIIVFAGIYLFVRSLYKRSVSKKDL